MINCEQSMMTDYSISWHGANEKIINDTAFKSSRILSMEDEDIGNSTLLYNTYNERVLPNIGYGDLYWAPLLKMTVYIFGSRREIQPTDIYSMVYADSR